MGKNLEVKKKEKKEGMKEEWERTRKGGLQINEYTDKRELNERNGKEFRNKKRKDLYIYRSLINK